MKISHQQARRRFEAALDTAHYYGRKPELDPDLAEHIAGCRECRAYTEQAAAIDARLAQQLPQTCQVPIPSNQKIDAAVDKVQSRARRKRMIRFMTTTTRRVALLTGSLALIVGFVFLLNRLLFDLPMPLGDPTSTSPAPVVEDEDVVDKEKNYENVTITFAAEPAVKSVYQPLIDAFHQEHPNIIVQFVEVDPMEQIDLPTQAALADTSLLSGRSTVMTGAGYFRELTPLIETDPDFQPDDFWPNALTGCQDGEGRSFGVPVSLFFNGILYDPKALDADGLAHPRPGWTWDEFQQLVTAMSTENTPSRQYPFVDLPVYRADTYIATTSFLAPILDQYLVENNGAFDSAALAGSLQWYLDLVQEKRIFPVTEYGKSEALENLYKDGYPAMWIGAINSWVDDGPALEKYDMAPFPVDSSAPETPTNPMSALCGVVSAGSNHPQEAWLWLNFISHQWIHGDERLAYVNEAIPARPSVVNGNPIWENIPAKAQEAIRFGLEHGWYGSPYPDVLWAVTQAVIESANQGTDLISALDQAKIDISNLPIPEAPKTPVVVATPRPQHSETTPIRFFTYQMFESGPMVKSLVEEFTRLHPEIQVELSNVMNPVDYPSNYDERFTFQAENYDCFELDLPDLSTTDLSILYDLNTWLDQDPTLRSDIYPGQLEAYTVDGKVFGLPASLQPNLMFYNKDLLARLGIEEPKIDWTFDDFIRLATAASTTLDGQQIYGFAPYAHRDVGLLLAGQGIDWLDLSGAYPSTHLNEPATLDAYRWMYNLVQSGVLLPTTFMDSSEAIQTAIFESRLAFWTAESLTWGGWYVNQPEPVGFQVGGVPLPQTQALNAANNPGMTGLFISKNAQNPGACWAWMKFVSEQPNAFAGVPARRSVAASPAWEAAVGAEKAAVYRAAAEQGVMKPSSSENHALSAPFAWSSEALGSIINGTDPELALATAQRKVDTLNQCLDASGVMNLPAMEREAAILSCLDQVSEAVR